MKRWLLGGGLAASALVLAATLVHGQVASGGAPQPAPAFGLATQRPSENYGGESYGGAVVAFTRGKPMDENTMKLERSDRELSQMVVELAAKYKAEESSEARAETQQQLAEAVAKQFAIRQSMREKQLAELAAQLERLRKLHAQRIEQQDRIVADRVQQLLREAEGLGWGDVGDTGGAPMKVRTDFSYSPYELAPV